MSTRKSVAVIGTGPSGLVAMKTALEYGFEVKGFDVSSVVGGLWNYEVFKTDSGYQLIDNYDQPIQAVYKSLLLNTSKESSAFSDFVDETTEKTFPSHWDYLEYIKNYVDAFGLRDHIQLNSRVTKLTKNGDKWRVAVLSGDTSSEQTFDFVMIATGCFKFPNVPPMFEGVSSVYKGVLLHTSQVRDEAAFKGKRVFIAGGGYSGCEVAVGALSNDVDQIYFCFTNNPKAKSHWVMDRWVDGFKEGQKIAWDLGITRDNYLENPDKFGAILLSWLHLFYSKDGTTDPKLRFPGDKLATSNIEMLKSGIESGKIRKVEPIQEFHENGVVLTDGTRLGDIDFIIMGTGYVQRYPFLDHIWDSDSQKKCELYRYLLHPDPEMDGLTFICSCASAFVLFLTMELQARWICDKIYSRDYDSEGHLFSDSERASMWADIKEARAAQPDDMAYNFLVDGPGYWEILSKELQCNPPCYDSLLASSDKEDRQLAVALRYGPIFGPHYRVQGPHAWQGAKQLIIKVARETLGDKEFDELVKATGGMK